MLFSRYFPCLKNKPKLLPAFQQSMNDLPGEIMDTPEQCKSYHGSAAIPCQPRVRFLIDIQRLKI